MFESIKFTVARTIRARMSLRALAVWAVLCVACTDASPCVRCAAIDGTYAVSWRAPQTSGACSKETEPSTLLNITQAGSSLTTVLKGQQLTGTLYDTNDFSFFGATADTSYALRGFLAVLGADGSTVQVTGTLHTTVTDSKGGSCLFNERFTGNKL